MTTTTYWKAKENSKEKNNELVPYQLNQPMQKDVHLASYDNPISAINAMVGASQKCRGGFVHSFIKAPLFPFKLGRSSWA